MVKAFDYVPDRPEHIETILNGLDRYNPETTSTFQDYVQTQCENQTYDCYANLALLKLYQFNPHLSRDETITNILVKALTVFPSPDFSLCLSLLPPHVLQHSSASTLSQQPAQQQNGSPAAQQAPPPPSLPTAPPQGSLAEAVQRLEQLHSQLNNAEYEEFWASLDDEDSYADLVADVTGFEELMRVRMAVVISQCMQSVDAAILGAWLNLGSKEKLEKFVSDVCGWRMVDGGKKVEIPLNKENEARSTVARESVRFEQFGRTVRRAYEQPA